MDGDAAEAADATPRPPTMADIAAHIGVSRPQAAAFAMRHSSRVCGPMT